MTWEGGSEMEQKINNVAKIYNFRQLYQLPQPKFVYVPLRIKIILVSWETRFEKIINTIYSHLLPKLKIMQNNKEILKLFKNNKKI